MIRSKSSMRQFKYHAQTRDFDELEFALLVSAVDHELTKLRRAELRHRAGRWTPGSRTYHEWCQ